MRHFRASVLALAAMLLVSAPLVAADWPACGKVETWPADDPAWPMPPATPPGWDEAGLDTVRDTFERLASAALVVLHQGRVVLALGDVDERYTGQSLRKPFVGALIGLAIAEGRLSLETTLAELELGTDDPPLLPGQEQATIENLLMSRSGIMHSALYEVGYWKRRRAELLAADRGRAGPRGRPARHPSATSSAATSPNPSPCRISGQLT